MSERFEAYAEGSYWYYAPNKVAPAVFASLFLLSGIAHAYQCHRYNCWRIGFFLPWAAALFTGAFITREIGAFDYDNKGVYIASTVLFLIAAPVYEGANYFLLGRILYYIPYNSPIHPGRVVITLLGVDFIIAIVTGIGAARVSNSHYSQHVQDTGKALLKTGLVLQLLLMATYVCIALSFHRQCAKRNTLSSNLRTVLAVLYSSCGLITVRTLYRTVEYFEAESVNLYSRDRSDISPLLKQEWYFWVFEVTVMFINTVVINVWHPSRYLPRNNKIYLRQDGVTEVEGPGYFDERSFLMRWIDPFDVVGLFNGRDKKNRFWEEEEQVGLKTSRSLSR
ncbi:hypothetical protein CYLTODRAFT_437765 [Cylindrobasidium torrendii FP15055 ss-10]|uniref:RTA1-domain-containing protein n=1 Tax=Cylindrobasidium torrendii FP15055 ss-10 TaxID=1314674 RepID=A0A0D7B582_9AGAR|nr:hypothetical protein CYLTODRAFT_437765 [Cylindrobasidium torrendii FP15055 ss-10]